MTGLHSGEGEFADLALLGLTDKISGAVSDYYDLLLDNVAEYLEMNRAELKGYEAEEDELRKKLEHGGMTDDERRTLIENRAGTLQLIGSLREFLDSPLALKVGFNLSEEMLDDNEPELTDRFNAAPVAEKYACLVRHYMEEHRAGQEARSEQPGTAPGLLASIDAFRFGVEKVREVFPEIAERHEELNREERRELLVSDPVKLHSDLIVEYSTAYIADMGRLLRELRHDHDAFLADLRKHDAAKPGWLKNLATFGEAGKAWKEGRERLEGEITGSGSKIAELQNLRENCKDGWLSESARRHAKGEIRARHPEVVEACERHMARHWEKTNEERLEKQEARQNERGNVDEKTRDDRSGFGRREWI